MKQSVVQNITIFESIKSAIEDARNKAKQSINHIMTEAYWNIGFGKQNLHNMVKFYQVFQFGRQCLHN